MPVEQLKARLASLGGAPGRGRPFFTLAYAQSLDGSLAAVSGHPLRLSSDPALELTHQLRALHDGILVGVDTVIADDPRLDVRLAEGASPQPIVLDSQLRIPSQCVLLTERRPWIATTPSADPARRLELEAMGAVVLVVEGDARGWVDLHRLAEALLGRGLRSVMVEGGERTISSFLRARLADHAMVTVAPRLIGGLNLGRSGLLDDVSPRLIDWEVARTGEDLLIGGPVAYAEGEVP